MVDALRQENDDVLAALAWLREQPGIDPRRIGVMGISFGGIMTMLKHHKLPVAGKEAVVVGRSPILGKPMAAMLLNANATVTICHSKTQDLPGLIRRADIVVGAVGKPEHQAADAGGLLGDAPHSAPLSTAGRRTGRCLNRLA